eukprot:4933213-Amphidinium_carterae.1
MLGGKLGARWPPLGICPLFQSQKSSYIPSGRASRLAVTRALISTTLEQCRNTQTRWAINLQTTSCKL